MAVLKLRVVLDNGGMVGPGKAELLERIIRTGSIAAAGREMGMSYKRAWQLIDLMNGMFESPVVVSSRGGSGGGGADVTETGRKMLAAYRGFEAACQRAGAEDVERLEALASDIAGGK